MIPGRVCSLNPLRTLFSYFQFSYFQQQLNRRMHRKGRKEQTRRAMQQRPNVSRKTAPLTTPQKTGGYYIWAMSRRSDWMPCANASPTLRGFPQAEFRFAKFRGSINLTTETHREPYPSGGKWPRWSASKIRDSDSRQQWSPEFAFAANLRSGPRSGREHLQ
jgi:hypothetical protein